MHAEFWQDKWAKNQIGFHIPKPNPLLVKHFDALNLMADSRVLVPLCGKTLDIGWLLSQGCRVVGIELCELAVAQLLSELGIESKVETKTSGDSQFQHHQAAQLDIFVGDIFNMSSSLLGVVDAIYDRGALIALPADIRKDYARKLLDITSSAKQLLITLEFEQRQLQPPPFSVNTDEVKQHYGNNYTLQLRDSVPVPGGLKGGCEAIENVWLLGSNETPH